jgi:hypothetical protein
MGRQALGKGRRNARPEVAGGLNADVRSRAHPSFPWPGRGRCQIKIWEIGGWGTWSLSVPLLITHCAETRKSPQALICESIVDPPVSQRQWPRVRLMFLPAKPWQNGPRCDLRTPADHDDQRRRSTNSRGICRQSDLYETACEYGN